MHSNFEIQLGTCSQFPDNDPVLFPESDVLWLLPPPSVFLDSVLSHHFSKRNDLGAQLSFLLTLLPPPHRILRILRHLLILNCLCPFNVGLYNFITYIVFFMYQIIFTLLNKITLTNLFKTILSLFGAGNQNLMGEYP